MQGFLIDEDEFEVKPAIARVAQVMELETTTSKRAAKKFPPNPNEFLKNFLFFLILIYIKNYVLVVKF